MTPATMQLATCPLNEAYHNVTSQV